VDKFFCRAYGAVYLDPDMSFVLDFLVVFLVLSSIFEV